MIEDRDDDFNEEEGLATPVVQGVLGGKWRRPSIIVATGLTTAELFRRPSTAHLAVFNNRASTGSESAVSEVTEAGYVRH